ncbi:MAG: TraB/GumN family protein [Gammaproteobacteria bacterium]|nr:MAG: TraB/GumN family protein [Gammaproteobacteria bacterium]
MLQFNEIEPNVDLVEVDGRRFYLVGTAHVSDASARLVERVIRDVRPDTVCVELCDSRYETITNPERWKETDLYSVIRSGRAYVLMAQLALAAYQRKLAEEFRIRPGEEMHRAIAAAKEVGAEIALVDREIRTTLKRAWARAGFFSLLRMAWSALLGVFAAEKISAEEIEKLKGSDELTLMLEEFSGALPGVKEALIDERDRYLAAKIRQAPGQTVVAVVGAGHVPGIRRCFDQPIDIAELETLPPPRRGLRLLGWAVPLALFLLVAAGFVFSGRETGEQMILAWVLANGVAAAAGTLLALAHPLTILAAFLAAPLTSLNPTIAAGWVCGLVEAWVRKPRVRDLERVAEDLSSVTGIWRNRVTRILLVVVLANLGSSIGTVVGVGWILSLFGKGAT